MDDIFSKVDISRESILGEHSLEYHIKPEVLQIDDISDNRPLDLKKESDGEERRTDSDDNDDPNLNKAASVLEDMLTNTGELSSSSDRKENITQSLPSTGLESDIILPKPPLNENKKDKKKEKSKKELEEEEREKMQ